MTKCTFVSCKRNVYCDSSTFEMASSTIFRRAESIAGGVVGSGGDEFEGNRLES